MNSKQYNSLNMFHGVNGVLEANSEIYSDIPMVIKTADSFASVVDQINEIASEAESDTSGVTSEKSKIKELLAQKASYLGSSAYVYAFDQMDMMMAAALSYSYSDIRYTKDSQALQIALTILGEIDPLAEELAEYGVTAEELTEFKNVIEEYNDILEDKVEVRASGVAETKQLAFLVNHGNDLLRNKLDGLLFRYKFKKPEFYHAYQNARMIIDL